MTSLKSSGSFNPFDHLDKFLRIHSKQSKSKISRHSKRTSPKSLPAHGKSAPPARQGDSRLAEENEKDLFMEAMADVKPLSGSPAHSKISGNAANISHPEIQTREPGTDVILKLDKLVKHGEGFIVENTPEYKEWTGFKINPRITKRLHRGDFSIQEYIDLHGLNAFDAKTAFDAFLKQSIETRKQAVLIVHGRGLSSPYEPVLKEKVYEWLASGQWNKWIVAVTSAKLHDGGAGATYVLLRPHPLPKRLKKSKAKKILDK